MNARVGAEVVNINVAQRTSVMDKVLGNLKDEGALFDIIEQPHKIINPINGKEVYTGRKEIINANTGAFLANMSGGYNPAPNEDCMKALIPEIAKTNLNLDNMDMFVDVASEGAQTAIRFIFPDNKIDIGGGDETAFMITALNSFNGTSSFVLMCGGYRFTCANGQVLGTSVVSYRKQHCKDLSLSRASQVIGTGIQAFEREGEIWKVMAQTQVQPQQAYNCLADLADVDTKLYPTFEVYNKEVIMKQKRTTKLANYKRIYESYVKEMGRASEFALYNTLTEIGTHGAAKSGRKVLAPSSMEKRNKDVAKVATKHLVSYATAA